MAGITFYDAYFPTFISSLNTQEAILVKAQTYAKENGIDVDTEYVPARLYEDMYPLPFQTQAITNIVRLCVNRLTGAAEEEWTEELTTFDQILARVKKAQDLLNSIRPEDINGKETEERDVQLEPYNKKVLLPNFIQGMILPNIFFHLQTTYAILRMKGVPLGKMDYLMPFLRPNLD